jgi:hypothetical protein
MTDQQHPITPPPELVQQWLGTYFNTTVTGEVSDVELALATQAARWGADQELEACLTEVSFFNTRALANKIRDTRRPKPPSLKEQALDILKYPKDFWSEDEVDTIRRALEQLDD